jgi:hypothetical protein
MTLRRRTLAVLGLLTAATFCIGSRASDLTLPGVPSSEVDQWEDNLRQTGASAAELARFEGLLRDLAQRSDPLQYMCPGGSELNV